MSTSAKEHARTLTPGPLHGHQLTGKGCPSNPHVIFKSSVGKGERDVKEETKKTAGSTCLPVHRHAQLGLGKGGDALLVLVAVAPVTVKPVGGAMELWLGCRSLGMPL